MRPLRRGWGCVHQETATDRIEAIVDRMTRNKTLTLSMVRGIAGAVCEKLGCLYTPITYYEKRLGARGKDGEEAVYKGVLISGLFDYEYKIAVEEKRGMSFVLRCRCGAWCASSKPYGFVVCEKCCRQMCDRTNLDRASRLPSERVAASVLRRMKGYEGTLDKQTVNMKRYQMVVSRMSWCCATILKRKEALRG